MKKSSPLLILLGLLPLAVGFVIMSFTSSQPNLVPPYLLIGLLLLVVWVGIGYLTRPFAKTIGLAVSLLNLAALIMLMILAFSILVLHDLGFPFGFLAQIYYLPLIYPSSLFISWLQASVLSAACISFALMLGASYLGCKLRDRR